MWEAFLCGRPSGAQRQSLDGNGKATNFKQILEIHDMIHDIESMTRRKISINRQTLTVKHINRQ